MTYKRPVVLLVLACAMITLAFGADGKHAVRKSNVAADQTKTLFGPLWQNGHGYSSTVILRNRDRQQTVNAEIVLFSHRGHVEYRSENIEVAPDSAVRLPLAKIIGTERKDLQWGSLAVGFSRTSRLAVIGQVLIENETKGLSFDLPLSAGNALDTDNALSASWWLPDTDSKANIVLFNSSSQEMQVTPSLSTGGSEQACEPISLSGRETRHIAVRELMRRCNAGEAPIGSITLRYTGQRHSLIPALLLFNRVNGFHLSPAFNGRQREQTAGQTTWRFPTVLSSADSSLGLGKNEALTAYALLSNMTTSELAPKIGVLFDAPDADAVRMAPLPVSPLKPLETRLVDVSRLIDDNQIPARSSHFSLQVGHDHSSGALALTVFSVGKDGSFVFASQGGLRGSTVVDSSYWDISDDLTELVTMQNESSRPVAVRPTLQFNAANGPVHYNLPPINLPENASQVINLKKTILSGVPDENGVTIPAGTTFGTMTLSIIGGKSSDMIAGGSIAADPDRGAYGGLEIPACNDPGPWNGFVVYYLDGIELPSCADFLPAVDVCAIFGDCGGGGDPGLLPDRLLKITPLSSCSGGGNPPAPAHLFCAWRDPNDPTCSQANFKDAIGKCVSIPTVGPELIVSAPNGATIYSCEQNVYVDNACKKITFPANDGIIETFSPATEPPPSDPPPPPDPPPSDPPPPGPSDPPLPETAN